MLKLDFKSFSLFLAVFLLLTSCANKKAQNNTADISTEQPKDTLEKPQEAPAPSEIKITKKDTAKTDDLVFVIKNVADHIPDNMYEKAKENEKYIAVQVWAKNISTSDLQINEEDFKLFDQEDAEFAESNGFADSHRKLPVFFSDQWEKASLKVNQAKSGWITFTTNKNSNPKYIQYKNFTITL